MKQNTLLAFIFVLTLNFAAHASPPAEVKPADFVDLSVVEPSILFDIRYAGRYNFVGERIPGYKAPKCLLTRKTAEALVQVQKDLKGKNFGLKIYDCYRPQRAVDFFVAWAKDLKDTRMKKEFYPRVEKENLFREGYIAEKSGHSRGSTVDLTMVALPVVPQDALQTKKNQQRECYLPKSDRFRDNSVDMGTGYDCFDSSAHTNSSEVQGLALKNRQILKSAMENQGFTNLAEEWWHYTLNNEPYPDRFFNFEIQ